MIILDSICFLDTGTTKITRCGVRLFFTCSVVSVVFGYGTRVSFFRLFKVRILFIFHYDFWEERNTGKIQWFSKSMNTKSFK